ncbi:MAG: cupin domain-containing protein [Chthoniobacter sp.]|nr:cupin domain-containing protein [Chthoniobacter sp.]
MQPERTNQQPGTAPVSAATAPHYAWGAGCDGWHLLQASGLSVIQESMPPGTDEVPHFHEHSRQFFFVLAGVLSVSTPDSMHRLAAEQAIEIPPGVPHHIRNLSDDVVRFLVISSPPSHGDRVAVAS